MRTADRHFIEWRIGYLKTRLEQEQSMLKQIDGWTGVEKAASRSTRLSTKCRQAPLRTFQATAGTV